MRKRIPDENEYMRGLTILVGLFLSVLCGIVAYRFPLAGAICAGILAGCATTLVSLI